MIITYENTSDTPEQIRRDPAAYEARVLADPDHRWLDRLADDLAEPTPLPVCGWSPFGAEDADPDGMG